MEMRDAFRRGNTTALTTLLPRVQGHPLEPLAAYWEARARLVGASPEQMREALARHPGTYWEDRLRNDWLLHLGKQRDWAHFSAELPRFRMNDDRQVQCYALMLDVSTNAHRPPRWRCRCSSAGWHSAMPTTVAPPPPKCCSTAAT